MTIAVRFLSYVCSSHSIQIQMDTKSKEMREQLVILGHALERRLQYHSEFIRMWATVAWSIQKSKNALEAE